MEMDNAFMTTQEIAFLKTRVAELEAESRIAAITFESQVSVMIMDARCRILRVNKMFEGTTGYYACEVMGKTPRILKSGKHHNDFYRTIWNEVRRSGKWYGDLWNKKKNGDIYPESVTISAVYDNDHRIVNYISISRDISWRKAAEERIKHLTKLYQARSEISEAIIRMEDEVTLFPLVCRVTVKLGGFKLAWFGRPDEEGRIRPLVRFGEHSENLSDIFVSASCDVPEGHGPSGIAWRESRSVVINDVLSFDEFKPWLEFAKTHSLLSMGCFPIMRGGSPFAVFVVYRSMVNGFDEDSVKQLNELSLHLSFALDNFDREIQRKKSEHQIHQMAYFDALTALPNRRLLCDRFETAVAHAHRSNTYLCICMIDLDYFKSINDSHGHGFGDEILVTVANRLGSALRGEDTAARVGGDEFVLLLRDFERTSDISTALQRIVDMLSEPYDIQGKIVNSSVSLGASVFSRNHPDLDTLICQADVALYKAKQAGRGQYHMSDSII